VKTRGPEESRVRWVMQLGATWRVRRIDLSGGGDAASRRHYCGNSVLRCLYRETVGSYRCVSAGAGSAGDVEEWWSGRGRGCCVYVDVDECRDQAGTCQQVCRNTWGSFYCACRRGYRLGADAATCTGRSLIIPLYLLVCCIQGGPKTARPQTHGHTSASQILTDLQNFTNKRFLG